MSDHKEEKAPAAAPAGAAKPGLPIPLIGAAVGALVLGTVLGLFVIAPRVVGSRGAAAQPAAADAAGHGESAAAEKGGHGAKAEKGGHGGSGGHGEAGSVHRIENLIVNPAGSQGRRFLMMTVAIQVTDGKVESGLRAQDAQLRDAIIGALETQPMAVITGPGGRDSVRTAIRRAITPIVGEHEPFDVFLPQFVLQ